MVIVRRLEIPQKSTSKALLGVQTLTLVWGCNVWDSCSQRCSAYSQHDLGAPSATVGGAGLVSRSDGQAHVRGTDSRHVKPEIDENRPRGGSQRRWSAGGRFLAGARRRRTLVILAQPSAEIMVSMSSQGVPGMCPASVSSSAINKFAENLSDYF